MNLAQKKAPRFDGSPTANQHGGSYSYHYYSVSTWFMSIFFTTGLEGSSA